MDLVDPAVFRVNLYGIIMTYVALYEYMLGNDWLPNADEPALKHVTWIQVAHILLLVFPLAVNQRFKSHLLFHLTRFKETAPFVRRNGPTPLTS